MKSLPRATEGATAVEMALILPVLLLLFMGIMEGGRILSTWVVLTNETREAARYGIAGVRNEDGGLAGEVTAYATGRIETMIPGTVHIGVTVTPMPDGSGRTQSVTVAANSTITMVTPFMRSLVPGGVPVGAQSIMRAE